MQGWYRRRQAVGRKGWLGCWARTSRCSRQDCDGLYPQPEKLAVGVERKLRLGDVITAVSVRDKSFAALAHPLDRPADLAAGPGQNGLFGVVELLHAEAADDHSVY